MQEVENNAKTHNTSTHISARAHTRTHAHTHILAIRLKRHGTLTTNGAILLCNIQKLRDTLTNILLILIVLLRY